MMYMNKDFHVVVSLLLSQMVEKYLVLRFIIIAQGLPLYLKSLVTLKAKTKSFHFQFKPIPISKSPRETKFMKMQTVRYLETPKSPKAAPKTPATPPKAKDLPIRKSVIPMNRLKAKPNRKDIWIVVADKITQAIHCVIQPESERLQSCECRVSIDGSVWTECYGESLRQVNYLNSNLYICKSTLIGHKGKAIQHHKVSYSNDGTWEFEPATNQNRRFILRDLKTNDVRMDIQPKNKYAACFCEPLDDVGTIRVSYRPLGSNMHTKPIHVFYQSCKILVQTPPQEKEVEYLEAGYGVHLDDSGWFDWYLVPLPESTLAKEHTTNNRIDTLLNSI
jgi:hypothetical protein